jgi:hypothetical protein
MSRLHRHSWLGIGRVLRGFETAWSIVNFRFKSLCVPEDLVNKPGVLIAWINGTTEPLNCEIRDPGTSIVSSLRLIMPGNKEQLTL